MKVIKKNRKPLLIIILAASLAILIAAAVIINAVLNAKDNAEETENTIEIIEGLEDRTEAGAAVAYTYVDESEMILLKVEGKDTEYTLVRENATDEKSPASGAFLLYYRDANGNLQKYYPDIVEKDPTFNYEDLYAKEDASTNGLGGYKLTYLCVGVGTTMFRQRINVPTAADERNKMLSTYGLSEADNPVRVSFDYVAKDGTRKTHRVTIGDKLINNTGYYFMVDDRDYVYTSSNSNYFEYALKDFAFYISPILTAAGLDMDSTFEPYLTTGYEQWKNTVHKDIGTPIVNDSRVIANVKTVVPYVTKSASDASDGYIRDNAYLKKILDLKEFGANEYKRFRDALMRPDDPSQIAKIGKFEKDIAITLETYSKIVDISAANEYKYTIVAIESIITETQEKSDTGTPVGDGKLLKITYNLTVGGEAQSIYPMHGVIDISSELVPEAVRAALSAASVGTLSTPVEFSIVYNGDNAVNREVKTIVSEIVKVTNAKGETVGKVEAGTTVLYHYYYTVDGKKLDDIYTNAIKITDDLTGEAKTVAEKLMGRGQSSNLAIEVNSYTEHDEIVADFITYLVSGIDYFVTSECVVAFEFQQASDRDPFYGESLYKNQTPGDYVIYGLNASSCEAVVKVLGGILDSNAAISQGLRGFETVAVGISAENMEKYRLFANTVYFELPRGITAVEYDKDSGQSVEDYLTTLDDYTFYSNLGFTLYISDEQPDGTRYIASTLYDVIAKVKADDFIFLDQTFSEFYARRNILLTNIANIASVDFDLFMTDIYGSYDIELTHSKLYAYGGKLYTQDKLPEEAKDLASSYNAIDAFVTPSGECSDTALLKFIQEKGYTGVSLYEFYGKKLVELDSLGTSNFRELMELIFYTYYAGVLTDAEKAQIDTSPLLMKMKVTLGKHPEGVTSGTYEPTSSFDYSYEFYRVSDRKIAVRVYRESRIDGSVSQDVNDFYISTFAFKKIVNAYVSMLNGINIDNESVDGVKK